MYYSFKGEHGSRQNANGPVGLNKKFLAWQERQLILTVTLIGQNFNLIQKENLGLGPMSFPVSIFVAIKWISFTMSGVSCRFHKKSTLSSTAEKIFCCRLNLITPATAFHQITGFPRVCGTTDGTHVVITPPSGPHEPDIVTWKQFDSINVIKLANSLTGHTMTKPERTFVLSDLLSTFISRCWSHFFRRFLIRYQAEWKPHQEPISKDWIKGILDQNIPSNISAL